VLRTAVPKAKPKQALSGVDTCSGRVQNVPVGAPLTPRRKEEDNELPTLAELLESAEGTGEDAGEDPATVR
jgi:hypothetical protein